MNLFTDTVTFWFSSKEVFHICLTSSYITCPCLLTWLKRNAVLNNTQQLMHHSGRASMALAWLCKWWHHSVPWT